ncbi:MAG: PadR family transcriptional regulator [Chloroflexi bacterium]|nr:PadR family transcriptional regulator [Chloroflexota bacterium]
MHHHAAHGYALIEGLNKLGLEAYPADVSTVYRVLYDLEAAGMVTSTHETEQTAGPPRRVYQLTEEGQAYLASWVQELEQTDRMLHRFLEAYQEHVEGDAAHTHNATQNVIDQEGAQ